ncbi:glutamate racemase [Candidatus Saccharibacteria bacterium]|nr:glutamate racemase [Candidatus Saccharibacteria bacterium]
MKRVVGVFDSGIGGLSVAKAIERKLPDLTVLFRNDQKHVPYGSRPPQELKGYVVPILNKLVSDGASVIVIACNTVTTTLISELRKVISVPLIGIEPMVKPAVSLTKSGVIAVCATPTTLASNRYAELKNTYAVNTTVLEPDCSDWSSMIEAKDVDKDKLNSSIDEVCRKGADVIVLGCTHYHWIEQEIIIASANRAQVLQPEEAIIERLQNVLVDL